jgi:hypothetical protein
MISVTVNADLDDLKALIHEENLKVEKVEVLLSNLLSLQDDEGKAFSIPFDDLVVTIQTAITILQS